MSSGASPLQRRKEKADYRSICESGSVENAILYCGASQPRADLTSTVSSGRCADFAAIRRAQVNDSFNSFAITSEPSLGIDVEAQIPILLMSGEALVVSVQPVLDITAPDESRY